MKRFFILLIFLGTLLLAENNIDIDSYINRIKKASPETRVQLMNEFKQKIAQMNKEERLKSIQQIRAKMKVNSHKKNHTTMQTQHGNEINTHQNMNQKQATTQVEHEENHMDGMKHKAHK
jgi:hypothetical protein